MTLRIEQLDGVAPVDPAAWDELAGQDNPFLRHAYFEAVETTGAVGPGSGWTPRHLAAYEGEQLLGVLPLYSKTDSWGEFVFDFAWADAYERSGAPWYPKLLTAVPYTPVTGRRILADETTALALIAAARQMLRDEGLSSWQVLFCDERDRTLLRAAGLLLRQDCQFHWFNHDYADFAGYLTQFRSARRKKTRRERRKVEEAGITFEWRRGDELDQSAWQQFYRFYANSFVIRGRPPYFDATFFPRLASSIGQQMQVLLARRDGEAVAAALFFVGGGTLFGRYWGCSEFHDALHFETCYYQGIEFAIANGLQHFDPGTQGEHKIARGFGPVSSWSAHDIAEPAFRRALDDYLRREREHIDAYMEQAAQHLPFQRRDER